MAGQEDIEKVMSSGMEKLQIEDIRPNQRAVIESYLKGNDVLFCSPVGTDKSLTYEIAPFVFKELHNTDKVTVIVVSPFIARRKYQNEKAKTLGMKCVDLRDVNDGCEVTSSEDDLVADVVQMDIEDLEAGEASIIFTSPELLLGKFRDLVTDLDKRQYIKAIFIDEAHCITKLGTSADERDPFRPSYGQLGELRSLSRVPVVALTASASELTQDAIINSLGMTRCDKVLFSPNKDNIKYWVCEASGHVVRDFEWLVDVIEEQGINTARMIIFFPNVGQIGNLYGHLAYTLKDKAYVDFDPNGRNDDRNRLFDMFHRSTCREVKDTICKCLMDPDSFKRVVLVPTSSSMELDIHGVDHIIHYGPAKDVEDYMLETGKAGRHPEEQAHAILITHKRCLTGKRPIDDCMRDYCTQKTCRRVQMMKYFVTSPVPVKPAHSCCDVCSDSCRCLCECESESQCDCDSVCSGKVSAVVNWITAPGDSSDEYYSSDDIEVDEYTVREPIILKYSSDSYSSESESD